MRLALWLGAEARGAQQLGFVDLDVDGHGEQDREMGRPEMMRGLMMERSFAIVSPKR